MKRIIINADDFGLSTGCNLGILKAMNEGIVTDTTIMMNMPKVNDAIELAKRNNINSLGVHLNLIQGKPLLSKDEVPSLVKNDGSFKDIGSLLCEFNSSEVEKELREQIKRFLKYGLKLSHLDSHYSIHMQKKIRHIFVKLSIDYSVPLRRIVYSKRDLIKIIFIKRYTTTDKFSGEFYGDNLDTQTLKNIILKLPDNRVSEIMCHPAYVDYELTEQSDYNQQRMRELEILTSAHMRNWIKNQAIELGSYQHFYKDFGKYK